jgi:hypothetical protein
MTYEELKIQLGLGGFLFGQNKECKEIVTMLKSDEKPIVGGVAIFNKKTGLLVATNQRVIFVSKIAFTEVVEEIHFKAILNVKFQSSLMAELEIFTAGIAFRFHQMKKEIAKELATYIKSQILQ